jgi:hypothetical protein
MRTKIVVSLILLLNVNSIIGHLCLWEPMQRGNFSLNPPGSHDCYRKEGPCGGFNSSTSKVRTILEAGTKFNVSFQQHLNHYYPGNPGKLDITFAIGLDPLEEDFRILYTCNDYNPMNHNTQTNFSIPILLPNEPCDYCVIRVRYITRNPDEEDHGTTFYQCSDIKLIKSSKNVEEVIINEISSIKSSNDPHDCCSPPSVSVKFIHWIPDIVSSSSGIIYYDKPSEQMHISMIMDGIEYSMWMNFTSGKQYYLNINEKYCHLFGLDSWNDWCFGNTFNQSEKFLLENFPCLSGEFEYCNRWENGDFLFDSTQFGCYPSALSRLSNGEKTIYYNRKDGPFTPSIFQPDPICLKNPIIMDEHHP